MKNLVFLALLLPSLCFAQKVKVVDSDKMTWVEGGINRADRSKKEITLAFTSDGYVDGYQTIKSTLKKHNIRGAFFFTGNFFRYEGHDKIAKGLIKDGHYIGPHSDKHLLWNTWEDRSKCLVNKVELYKDVMDNYSELAKLGIKKKNAPYMIPPYEWYNTQTSSWLDEIGVVTVNFSPGTSSNADYTIPGAKNYISSQTIYDRILKYEADQKDGLNGFMLLVHFGVEEARTDKLYDRLDELVTELKSRGYTFVPIEDLIKVKKVK